MTEVGARLPCNDTAVITRPWGSRIKRRGGPRSNPAIVAEKTFFWLLCNLSSDRLSARFRLDDSAPGPRLFVEMPDRLCRLGRNLHCYGVARVDLRTSQLTRAPLNLAGRLFLSSALFWRSDPGPTTERSTNRPAGPAAG